MLIDVVATGSGLKTLTQVLGRLEQDGFTPRVSDELFGEHPLHVNTDEKRLENLCQALYAPDSQVIWCLRGGSGTSRLLPELLADKRPAPPPKALIGFSDITALHLFSMKYWDSIPIHGPTLSYFMNQRLNPVIETLMYELVRGQPIQVKMSLNPLNEAARNTPTLTSKIIGGNLSLIQCSIGTPWALSAQDHLLFLEDLNEAPYRLAEFLGHLTYAGIFKGVKGILLGEFSYEKADPAKQELAAWVLNEFAQKQSIPVWCGFKVGHTSDNYPVQLGAIAQIRKDQDHFVYTQQLKI
jgi:muramoyltetrapeptide carboxypeptidase